MRISGMACPRYLLSLTLICLSSAMLLSAQSADADQPDHPTDQQSAVIDAPTDHLRVLVFQPLSIDSLNSDGAANDPSAAVIGQAIFNVVQTTDSENVRAPSWSELRAAGSTIGSELTTVLETAHEAGAQAAIYYSYFREGKRITLIGKIYDVWQSRLIAGLSQSGLDDLGLLNLVDSMTRELLGKLKQESKSLIQNWGNNGATGMTRSLVFRSRDELARVKLEGGDELGIIHDHVLALPYRPLAVKQPIRIRIEKPGFYSRDYEFQVEGLVPEVKLPALYPHSKWTVMAAVDPIWIFGKPENPSLDLGLGAGLRYLPNQEDWYVQFWYMLKEPHSRSQVSGATQPTWVMHDLSLSVAVALLPPNWVVRVFVGVGLGAYITSAGKTGASTFFDPYLELPSIDVQINLHPIVLDFEIGSQYVFDSGINLLPQGLVRSTGMLRMGVGFKW